MLSISQDQQHTTQSDTQLPDERNKDESKTALSKTESPDSYTFSKKNESASQSEKRGKKKKTKSEREKSQKDDSSSDEDHRKVSFDCIFINIFKNYTALKKISNYRICSIFRMVEKSFNDWNS